MAAPSLEPHEMEAKLDSLLSSESYAERARQFAARYASMNGAGQNKWLSDFVGRLLR